MDTEEVLFKIFNEIVLLSELYTSLSEDQVVTTIETVNHWFSQLPPDVVDRYKIYLKSAILREETRGAFARSSVLNDHGSAFGLVDEE